MPRLAMICLALLAVASVAVAENLPELQTEGLVTFPRGGEDWPQWSGPAGNLTSLNNGVFDRDVGGDDGTFGLERLWSQPLGSAYSGILAVDGLLVTTFSDGESDHLVALDASTGAEQWRYRISNTFKGRDGSDDGPLATPTIADGMVYGLGARGGLFAVSLEDGAERWRLDLVADFGAVMPYFGFSTAPTVIDDLLVVETGGNDGRSISAFDRKTGALRWSTGDDPVSYQSPMAFDLSGKTALVAVTDRSLFGIAPETGELLWRHQHTEGDEPGFGETQPVPVGENGILLTGSQESVLFQVIERAEGDRVVEAWRSRALRSLSVPVPHEGYLYGYAGNFLTCVDAGTGEMVWKSRPPGGGNLVLIDGHLVILNRAGEILVAEATPEAYREVVRIKALERGYLTRPSFADGTVFVRNLIDIGAFRVTEARSGNSGVIEPAEASQLAEANWDLRGDFGAFVKKLATSENRREMVERFLAKHPGRPILEGPSPKGTVLVHFVYQGETPDLAVSGNFIPGGGEHAMHRVDGTDFHFRSYELPEKAVFSYRFSIFDKRMTDPANPQTTGPEGRERSVLATTGWRPPSHLREPEGKRGRIEKLPWKSELMDNERDVQIYLPPGYDEGDGRYPLLVVYNGDEALSMGEMDRSLDNLIGQTVAPLIAAFVPDVHWGEFAGSRTAQFTRAHVEELIPLLDATYRTDARREARTVLGSGSSSFAALCAALHYPQTISRAAVQSYRHGDLEEELMAAASEEGHDLELLFHWSSYGRVEARQNAASVVAALEKSGYRPTIFESNDGVGWGMWQGRIAEILEALFPLE